MSRRRIGNDHGFGSRSRMFVTDDAFEVDEVSGFWRVRRRIFFDDVLMVTLHGERAVVDWLGGIGSAILSLLLGLAAVTMALGGGMPGAIGAAVSGAVALTFATIAASLLVRGRRVVTIFGRRTMGRVSFPYRHARAGSAFDRVVERVRAAQARMARDLPPPEAPPADEVPG